MLNLTTLMVTGNTGSARTKKALLDAGILLATGSLSAMAAAGFPPTMEALYVPFLAAGIAALATFRLETSADKTSETKVP